MNGDWLQREKIYRHHPSRNVQLSERDREREEKASAYMMALSTASWAPSLVWVPLTVSLFIKSFELGDVNLLSRRVNKLKL